MINLPVLTTALPVLEKNPLTANDSFTGPTLSSPAASRPTSRPLTTRRFAPFFLPRKSP